ncbi:hypothetical protein B1T49_10815 [Mycobacterium persicum]|nr:hypothetical protein B1T49_10815 [Mycobacterium persicum]
MDASRAVDLSGVELVVAGDVTSPLTGPDCAAVLFVLQKGRPSVFSGAWPTSTSSSPVRGAWIARPCSGSYLPSSRGAPLPRRSSPGRAEPK